MDNIEQLAGLILEYQADIDWYGLCDDFGNIITDSDARKHALEEIINTLNNSPEDIISSLEENIEEFELEQNFESNESYIKTKELIKAIECFRK